MKENVTVVILAAGLGTRMKSKKAKVLHEAGGDTLLNHIIRAALHVAAPEKIIAVIGYQAEQVRQTVRVPGIRFAEQSERKGTAHAVLCARQAVESDGGQLLVLNGDGPLLRPATLQAILDFRCGASAGGAIVTTELADPTGYGRVVRDRDGTVSAIVEQKAATPEQLKIREINTGLYRFDAGLFWQFIGEVKPNNPAGEYYLTDMVEILATNGHPVAALLIEDERELLGINTRIELALADKILRTRKAEELMLSGVTIENPETVTIDGGVEIGPDSLIEANVQLRGATRIGANCRIATGCVLRDCAIADGVTILPYVVAESSSVEKKASVGPFSRLRIGVEAGENSHIGNFVELKKTRLGSGSKASHLAYLGDSEIGTNVNIGAGTITCNYDGRRKHQTRIEDGVFVGSNSTLVAPVTLSEGAFIAAGSVITNDVERDALALGRAFQVNKQGWAKKRRETQREAEPVKS
ncbi:MAG: bifunctional UDP-N-acetylglucosamine diphosphorylase/glucosamine-1-phosphate N-acetyltransferase GlmU [Acidobacteriaceae bacterium]|nr:bifunctional UDP-N-acetylglucosamine diphosphorylase/glucosamine-1-phosphate N-acetyltransferase GlmU [Acidobacteriaceae bacterium]MBV9781971.1 bifunctional UDP-N-acetylglucosamine diphosphorylase/glucosamine-1-phosphate N-acetyltransferase GlmU [Acidobacteriaceae bacterium]